MSLTDAWWNVILYCLEYEVAMSSLKYNSIFIIKFIEYKSLIHWAWYYDN